MASMAPVTVRFDTAQIHAAICGWLSEAATASREAADGMSNNEAGRHALLAFEQALRRRAQQVAQQASDGGDA